MSGGGTIDYFFTLLSPYAYLGHAALHEMAARRAATVRYRPVRLMAQFAATGGVPVGQRAPARQRYRLLELQRWREVRRLPLNLAPAHWPFDPELADRCVLALVAAGKDPKDFMFAAMRAVWAEERDVADRDTVAEMLGRAGFDGGAVLEAAADPAHARTLDGNTEAAIAADLPGVPGYVRDGEAFWGQDRLDLLEAAIASGRPAFRAG
ncbi:2-hydroxychromene-2-carboxylate isomerase [Coralloluteibacterium thermophilus]|uniref:2-hydroxychromene-2-carboxylate isomerase n=1 Tax=Coralloluteibacterium thermophilum TaxID=2707049 RepID=A0ABV9NKY8_9GAMM